MFCSTEGGYCSWLKTVFECFCPGVNGSVPSAWRQQFKQGVSGMVGVLYNVLGFYEITWTAWFFQCGRGQSSNFWAELDVDDPLERFPLSRCAAGVAYACADRWDSRETDRWDRYLKSIKTQYVCELSDTDPSVILSLHLPACSSLLATVCSSQLDTVSREKLWSCFCFCFLILKRRWRCFCHVSEQEPVTYDFFCC